MTEQLGMSLAELQAAEASAPTPDGAGFQVEETGFVEKFEGEPSPETLFERVHFKNGKIVKIEKISAGTVVSTETFDEGGND